MTVGGMLVGKLAMFVSRGSVLFGIFVLAEIVKSAHSCLPVPDIGLNKLGPYYKKAKENANSTLWLCFRGLG
jgi:hypothetical protein